MQLLSEGETISYRNPKVTWDDRPGRGARWEKRQFQFGLWKNLPQKKQIKENILASAGNF